MRDILLKEFKQVTLNANGNGTVKLGPTSPFQIWIPTSCQIGCSSNVKESAFTLYIGDTSFAYANSVSGSTGDTSGIVDVTLNPNEVIIGIWTGGDVGAVATLTLFGTNRLSS